ncbi:MAG: SsrA-binding protein SmpB [Armatimonadetes bacterium]|nr:MAG: SsrA-binding protein SmpB [Armatimonadota bacterium]
MSKRSKGEKGSGPLVIVNRRARHEYEILSSYEAGIALLGPEVKSVLQGQVNMTGAWCSVEKGELFVHDLDIAPYKQATSFVPDRRRTRKLLMHKKEIELLRRRTEERGLTLVPTKIYYKNGRIKVEVSLVRGRKKYDKRERIKERDIRRGRGEDFE